jgi:AcrR family transcriptional regulator
MDLDEAEARVLDAAESLFYDRGVQAVGMDDIRASAGVSLKRLYQCFPSKDRLVAAYLERCDRNQRERLTEFADAHETPADRILAVFDCLSRWFAEPSFRGCAFVNCYGELGATSPAVAEAARAHKRALRGYLAGLVAAADADDGLTDQLALLVEGALATAALFRSEQPALQAKAAARVLLTAARAGHPQPS